MKVERGKLIALIDELKRALDDQTLLSIDLGLADEHSIGVNWNHIDGRLGRCFVLLL